jgi:hypothetical protein
MSAAAQQQKIRRFVWTGAISAVTAMGAWYGAGLKTQSEIKEVCLPQSSALPTTSFDNLSVELRKMLMAIFRRLRNDGKPRRRKS